MDEDKEKKNGGREKGEGEVCGLGGKSIGMAIAIRCIHLSLC